MFSMTFVFDTRPPNAAQSFQFVIINSADVFVHFLKSSFIDFSGL